MANPTNIVNSHLIRTRATAPATESGVSSGQSRHEGMGWRVPVSIIAFFGSMIAVILWLFFYAGNFNMYQNFAVVVVIFLAFIGVMGATWASWGMRQSDWRSEKNPKPEVSP